MTDYYLLFENKQRLLEPNKSYIIGRGPNCDIVLSDKHVSRRHACLAYKPDGFLLSDLRSENGTWYKGEKVQEVSLNENSSFRISECNLSIRSAAAADRDKSLDSGDTMLFESKVAGIIELAHDESLVQEINSLRQLYNRKKESLADLAFHDKLTKLFNRRYFDSKLLDEITRSIRYRHPLCLLMIDIDHFKSFNDTYGHQKGDLVLAAVAGILVKSLRSEDIVCRYGGEEIAVILPETIGKNACKVAENCRGKVEQLSKDQAEVVVTVSIGVAELPAKNSTPENLIKAADEALYKAKAAGRNKVVI